MRQLTRVRRAADLANSQLEHGKHVGHSHARLGLLAHCCRRRSQHGPRHAGWEEEQAACEGASLDRLASSVHTQLALCAKLAGSREHGFGEQPEIVAAPKAANPAARAPKASLDMATKALDKIFDFSAWGDEYERI